MKNIIDWNIISRQRSALMGVAIIFVMMYHSSCAWPSDFMMLFRCGDFGVEIFTFLSAIGLSRSLLKNPPLDSFYKNRLLRILPAYCTIAIPMALFLHFVHGASWRHVVLFSLGLSYFYGDWTYWFISFILFCYLLAPILFRLKKKIGKPFCLFIIYLPISVVLHFYFNDALGPWDLLFVRFSTFILGLEIADFVLISTNRENSRKFSTLIISSTVLIITCYIFHLIRPLPDGTRYYLYMIMVVPICICLASLLEYIPRINIVLAWIGGITLELYILHEHVCIVIAKYFLEKPILAFLAAFIAAIIGAKTLSILTKAIVFKKSTKH
ncbi:MAG: acyltransferase [Bacteroidales bacterium]|nr:acyltransferase [Bacteroidales bacterium]